eukprot:SAG22_NODE_137_length_18056_cov_9.974940_11_plen_126_part_00
MPHASSRLLTSRSREQSKVGQLTWLAELGLTEPVLLAAAAAAAAVVVPVGDAPLPPPLPVGPAAGGSSPSWPSVASRTVDAAASPDGSPMMSTAWAARAEASASAALAASCSVAPIEDGGAICRR